MEKAPLTDFIKNMHLFIRIEKDKGLYVKKKKTLRGLLYLS